MQLKNFKIITSINLKSAQNRNFKLIFVRFIYRRDSWGHNGPSLITRVLKKLCQVENLASVVASDIDDVAAWRLDEKNRILCNGFLILPSHTFYPIIWQEWQKYFNTRQKENENLLNETTVLKQSVAIHIWNKMSSKEKAQKSLKGRQLFTQLAFSQCPISYQFAPETF